MPTMLGRLVARLRGRVPSIPTCAGCGGELVSGRVYGWLDGYEASLICQRCAVLIWSHVSKAYRTYEFVWPRGKGDYGVTSHH